MGLLGKDDVLKILQNLKQLFNDNRNFLVELDGRMGDGDLGLTMSKAFTVACDELMDTQETEPGKIFMKAGMLMAKAAPSTMGTLMGTGFMRGGKAIAGKSEITTVEGLPEDHPVKVAWIEKQVPQCGYCQPGQIMQAVSLLSEIPKPTDSDIDAAMAGNICRCGTYNRVRRAIHAAAKQQEDDNV